MKEIIIIDDDIALCNLIKKCLSTDGYSVDIANNGLDGYKKIRSANNLCLILLDIMLPDFDGFQVLDMIREEYTVPVLMLTAKSDDDSKIYGLKQGADDYLTKPFEVKELLARLRAITRRKETVTDNVLTFGNITLNRTNFELSSEKGSYKLTNKEFQMLEMLMSTPSNIISADTFMDKIWGYDTDSDISVVWVYISYLRKKLAKLDADVEIKVTRNVGYSLETINGK